MLFDFDDFDYDYDCDCGEELDGGEHYGCEKSECCEDCVYFSDCDGCGNIYPRAPLAKKPASKKATAKKSTAKNPAARELQAEKPAVSIIDGTKRPAQTKDWEGKKQRGAGVLWACFGAVALVVLILGAILS